MAAPARRLAAWAIRRCWPDIPLAIIARGLAGAGTEIDSLVDEMCALLACDPGLEQEYQALLVNICPDCL